MNYREFDNAVYEKCGRLTAQEQAVTGYKTKMDMNRSFTGLYLDPLYQNKVGSGEYAIKGTKDIFQNFRKTKKKVRKRNKEEEDAKDGKRTKAYVDAYKGKSKLNVLQLPLSDRDRLMKSLTKQRGDMQLEYSRLRNEVRTLWVERAVEAVETAVGGAAAVEDLVDTWDNMKVVDSISTSAFRMLSTNQMLRTLLTLDDISTIWLEKNVFNQDMVTGEYRSPNSTPASSIVSEEEIAEMAAERGFDMDDFLYTALPADDGEITSTGRDVDMRAPRRDITEVPAAPAPRRNITDVPPPAPRRQIRDV